jgi:hypothetical protein
VWFNWFGIIDLVVALTAGFLAGLGPFGFDVVPSTEPLALLPLALIPTAAVPLSIALHIVSLRRLRARAWAEGIELGASSQPEVIPAPAREETTDLQAIHHG